jgi:hypothetical protein
MVVPLVLAGLTAIGANSLPTIITTFTSPLCTAVRQKVAPALVGLAAQDHAMARQRPLGTSGATIMHLAQNWIAVNELLNPDTFFHSTNPADIARMEALRERLQAVNDDENASLNVLSGSYDTYEFEALAADGASVPGVLGPASEPNVKGELGAELSQPDGTPAIAAYAGPLYGEYLKRQARTAQDETQVYPALAPIIAQCK